MVVGVIENGRIVALSHCRIVAFFSCTCANYIWKGRMVLYILYIIFQFYISIYIINRAHAGEVVRQCDNATMRRSFPRAEKPFPEREIPFLRVRRPEFPPNRRRNFHPEKWSHHPVFRSSSSPKKSPFHPQKHACLTKKTLKNGIKTPSHGMFLPILPTQKSTFFGA